MYSLSDKQIDFILNDIRARGVETEDLQLNLLDHICCIIENGLEENGDFGQFYSKTVSSFYKKELKELEDETQLLLTFKHYYTMKKLMIISGAFATITFVFGSFFKIMHWPGASVLFFLGMISGCFLFLPLVFTLKAKETRSVKDKLIAAAGTIEAILFCLSSLFKVMHWPGTSAIWLITLAFLFFVFLPLYFFNGIRNPETKINTIVTSVMLTMIGGSLFLLTGLRGRSISDNETYAYIQSQELVKKMENQLIALPSSDKKKRMLKIYTDCEQLKAVLMIEAIGNTVMSPAGPDRMGFHEHNVQKTFFRSPLALGILQDMKKDVDEYNKSVEEPEQKINISHSILNVTQDNYYTTTNLWLLNNLTMIQLELMSENGRLLAKR